MSNAAAAFEVMQQRVGADQGTGEWLAITQQRIDQFADVTDDHQFIHVDLERAATETPFGGTIAHGFLTLSLLTHLVSSIPSEPVPPAGLLMGINYGLNKVRFITPVPSGSNVRASSSLSNVELKGSAVQATQTVTVEIEGVERPALVADWIGRMVYDS